jgi:hypothetical protein
MINSWIPADPGNSPSQTNERQQLCCSFEMIRASFQQEWANRGLYVIHGHKAPKPACTEQGLLVSVRSGVNARAVAAAHQSSRSACQGVPIGTRPTHHARCATSDHTQHRWSPTTWTVGPSTAGVNLACSQHSSGGCAISLGTAIQAARSPKARNPQQGRPGRNDSRCAGITK